jgi:hypothetical protein
LDALRRVAGVEMVLFIGCSNAIGQPGWQF